MDFDRVEKLNPKPITEPGWYRDMFLQAVREAFMAGMPEYKAFKAKAKADIKQACREVAQDQGQWVKLYREQYNGKIVDHEPEYVQGCDYAGWMYSKPQEEGK